MRRGGERSRWGGNEAAWQKMYGPVGGQPRRPFMQQPSVIRRR